jgi:hypothetical protein
VSLIARKTRMANANVVAGSNRLKHAMQGLRDKWRETEPTWNDTVRRRFEERYILPIDPAVDAALAGMYKLAEILDRVRRDCSDRSAMP